MALTWDTTDITDSESVCFYRAVQDDPNGRHKAGDRLLNPVTEVLIFATMGVGIGRITAENADEFYARVRLIEKLGGAMLIRAVDPETGERPKGEKAFITPDEVRAHIGLRCNVADISRAQFVKRHVTSDLDAYKRAYRVEAAKQQVAA